MAKDYNEYVDLGVRFLYPRNWFVRTETWDKGTYGITVDTPEGSFWSVSIYPKGVNIDKAAQDIVETLSAEYDQMEKTQIKRYVADYELTGYEVDFFYLDLTSTATALKFEDERRGYVIYWQTCDSLRSDDSLSRTDVFNAMTHTLVSNLTGQEDDWGEDEDEEQFNKALSDREEKDQEYREFLRRKYDDMRRQEEEERWRGMPDESDDDYTRRRRDVGDERIEDFLRASDDEGDALVDASEEEVERHYYDFDESDYSGNAKFKGEEYDESDDEDENE